MSDDLSLPKLAEDENLLMGIEQKESIKLTKNTKGYNWEIKLLSLDIDALEKLNNEMIKRFKND